MTLSGYPILRGPVSLIVNTEVCVGCTLQICKQLLGITLERLPGPTVRFLGGMIKREEMNYTITDVN